MNWTIDWMRTTPTSATPPKYVMECGWRCTGTDQGQTASVYSSCSFAAPENPDGTFTPYDKLTQDQVLGWVWASGVDKASAESAVQAQLDNLINPPVIQPPLPWAQQGATK